MPAFAGAAAPFVEQERGSHADEVETSLMLALAPERVTMERALRDAAPRPPGGGPLTRDPSRAGLYSPSGVWGDPTRATREKGERLAASLVAAMVDEIESLRRA